MTNHNKLFTRAVAGILVIFCSFALASGQTVRLDDVPAYEWTHGCSPTAGMILLGYWDIYGYTNYISGMSLWEYNQAGIENAIASQGHIDDYALYNGVEDSEGNIYPDMSEINPSGAHANDCLADFMGTSRSAYGLSYGATNSSQIAQGVVDYATWKSYSLTAGGNDYAMPTWEEFTSEIDIGRPVLFSVDTDRDGVIDHSVTAFAYRIYNGVQQYACRDTWSSSTSTISWKTFREVSDAYSWGIGGWTTFRPGETTVDAERLSDSGDWNDPDSWSSTPTMSTYAYVAAGKPMTISGAAQAGYLLSMDNVTINGGSLAVSSMHVDGNLTLNSGQITSVNGISVDGRFEWLGGSIQGTITGRGTFYATSSFNVGAPASGIAIDGCNTVELADGVNISQSSGNTILRHIYLGKNAGETNTFNYNSSGLLRGYNIYIGHTGTGYLNQNGGECVTDNDLYIAYQPGSYGRYVLDNGSVEAKYLLVGLQGDGKFTQNNGTVSVASGLYLGGAAGNQAIYEINDGELTVNTMSMESSTGTNKRFVLNGGSVQVTNLFQLREGDATSGFFMSGGSFNAHDTFIHPNSLFRQSGGSYTAEALTVKEGGTYEMSAGSLNVTDALKVEGLMDLENGSPTISFDSSLGYFGDGSLQNYSFANVSISEDSLVRFPEGFNPAVEFQNGSYTCNGVEYIAGNTCVIGAGQNLTTSIIEFDIDDHVDCYGSFRNLLSIYNSGNFNFTKGLYLHAGASVDLGVCDLTVRNEISGMEAGSTLFCHSMIVGNEQPGKFIQYGGTNTVEATSDCQLEIGYLTTASGVYELHDGLLDSKGHTRIGGHGAGRFIQTGGTHRTGDLWLYSSYDVSGGASYYEMQTGSLYVDEDLYVSGRNPGGMAYFIQTGGTVVTQDLSLSGYEETTRGCYQISDGTLTVTRDLIARIGSFIQTGGTVTTVGFSLGDDDCPAVAEFRGGKLNATDEMFLYNPAYQYDGHENTCATMLLLSSSYVQYGGTTSVTGQFNLGGWSPDSGSRYEMHGGEFNAANAYIGYYTAYGTFAQTAGKATFSTSLNIGDSRYFGLYDVGGNYEISGGELTAGALYVGCQGYGTLDIQDSSADITVTKYLYLGQDAYLLAVPGSSIEISSSLLQMFRNESTNDANLSGFANLTLVMKPSSATGTFEVAGQDMGAVTAGWVDNFVLNTLELGGVNGGKIRLVDNFDNQEDGGAVEALYVSNLVFNAGGQVDLNGLSLYYLNGGDPKQLFIGDCNLDGSVDLLDLDTLAYNWGNSIDVDWAEGDFNGDGKIDLLDLNLIAANWGSAPALGNVPEPATLSILAIGGLAMLRRRR